MVESEVEHALRQQSSIRTAAPNSACSKPAVQANLVNIEDPVEGSQGVADGKEGNEDQQAVIDAQGAGEFDIQHGCHVCPPDAWSQIACPDVQQHQQIIGLCDAPVLVAIEQHACKQLILILFLCLGDLQARARYSGYSSQSLEAKERLYCAVSWTGQGL